MSKPAKLERFPGVQCSHEKCTSKEGVRLVHWRIPMTVNQWYSSSVPVCAECRKKNRGHWMYAS